MNSTLTCFGSLSYRLAKIALAIFALVPTASMAQGQKLELILGNKTESLSANSGSEPIEVISADEIKQLQAVSLPEVIDRVSDLFVTGRHGSGQPVSINMRGGNSQHSLILVDGVPIVDPSSPQGSVDLNTLPIDNIKSIEILPSHNGLTYGSQAMGGVINLVTKTAQARSKPVEYRLTGGSFGYGQGYVQGATVYKDFAASIGLTHSRAEGFSAVDNMSGTAEKDGYKNTAIQLKASIQPNQHSTIRASSQYSLNSKDIDRGPNQDDPNYHSDTSLWATSIRYNTLAASIAGQLQGSLSLVQSERQYKNSPDPDDSTAMDSRFRGKQLRSSLHFVSNTKKTQHWIARLEGLMDQVTSEDDNGTNNYDRKVWSVAISQHHPGRVHQWNIGLRHDAYPGLDGVLTGEGSYGYRPAKSSLLLTAGVSSGFTAPSLFQLNDPNYGNPNLKPERAWGIDVGIHQKSDEISMAANLFFDRYDDLIGFDSTYRAINEGPADVHGIKLTASQKLNQQTLKASLTTLTAVDTNTGLALLRRPQHRAEVRWSWWLWKSRLNLAFKQSYVGIRQDLKINTNERTDLPAYALTGLNLTYKIVPSTLTFVKIENLFDEQFEEVAGYNTSGRAIYIGMRGEF